MANEKYNEKREKMLHEYKQRKLKNVLAVLGIGVAALIVVFVLSNVGVLNIAVTLVLAAMIVMMTVIFARTRAVTVNHIMENQLRLLEQENDYKL